MEIGFRQWFEKNLPVAQVPRAYRGPYWDLIYPTAGWEYPDVVYDPKQHALLQWRWERGLELGRCLHNIDNDDFQSREYKTIHSKTMPGIDGFWRHKEDKGPNLQVMSFRDFTIMGAGEKTDDPIIMTDDKPYATHRMGEDPKPPDYNLDQKFGDKPTWTYQAGLGPLPVISNTQTI